MTHKLSSLRIILSYAGITYFAVWSQDVNQAYIQSDEPLKRPPIYNKPPKILMLPDYFSCFIETTHPLPLYFICHSSDYWFHTFQRHLVEELKLNIPSNRAVFLSNNSECSGVLGSLVDDTIVCSDSNSAKQMNKRESF